MGGAAAHVLYLGLIVTSTTLKCMYDWFFPFTQMVFLFTDGHVAQEGGCIK